MPSTEVRPALGTRRKERLAGRVESTLTRITSRRPSRFDSWPAAIWAVTIGLDFFWVSNPVVLVPFDDSLHRAFVATSIALVLTLPYLQLPRPSPSVLAVLGFGFASALWSTDIGATARFTGTFTLVALLATVVAASADARTICHGMMLGGLFVLSASWYAFDEKLPHADVPAGAIGYLAGVGGNRNVLAYTMVLSLGFAVSFLPRHWWARSIWAAGSGAILVGIYLAQSATGYLVTLTLLMVGATLAAMDRRHPPQARNARQRWALRASSVLALAATAVGMEALSRALGRDPSTLTGRVPLWQAIWHSTTGVDRWFGSGWGAVWPHAWSPHRTNAAYQEIIDRIGYVLYHGHNSVFDLLPEIGFIGIAVYGSTYVHAIMRAFRLRDPDYGATPTRLAAGRATLLVMLVLLLFGVTEPISTIPLGWFMIVVLSTGLLPTTERWGRHAAPVAARPLLTDH